MHGQGIGSLLIKKAQAAAMAAFVQLSPLPQTSDKADPDVVMILKCFARNTSALRVYQRRGFELTSERIHAKDVDEFAIQLEWFGDKQA